MKKVLLVTHTHENPCAETVSESIRKKGGIPVRFNTDLYPGSTSLTVEFNDGTWKMLFTDEKGEAHDLAEFESLWYRRIRIGTEIARLVEQKFMEASIEESRRTFFGLLSSLDIFQFDHFLKIRRAENKQLQLKLAHELGLKIPKTLITNSPVPVRSFFPYCSNGIITKMQAAFAIYENGVENVVFTNSLGEEILEELDGIEYCPMTFQENIPKKLELRITIVGDKVFAASIDSQRSELARHDWRKQGLEMINDWEEFSLPDDISKKLLRLMDNLRLNYGAIDMILTPGDELYFLEVNPVGEFFWLERKPGFPVSDAIADVLLGNVTRRL
jgi:glutathione synthase/RimK-type ligase-like ATP-grasp enzyme